MVTLGSSSQPKAVSKAPKREEKKSDRYEKRNKFEKKEPFFNPTTFNENEEE